jgi:hypothetical protein
MQEPLQTSEANLVGEAQSLGSLSLAIAAGTLVAVAALLFLSRAAPAAVYGVAALAILELFIFARTYRATFPLASAGVPRVQQFLDQHPGDYRILNVIVPNAPLSADDIWGCDAGGTPLRYAEFMAVTQGRNPDAPSPYLNFQSFPPIYSMLRLHYLFWQEGEFSVAEIPNPLPRLLLVQSYRVLPSRDRIFEAMSQNFDPAKQVILEQEPDVHPLPTDQTGTVRLIDSSTDRLTIEADVPNPCILLITDGYSKDWHARALPGGVQQQYQVLPANYVLRAIPLGTGHHSIRLEYRPRLFVIGGWVSLLSLGGLAVTTGYALLKRRRQRQASGKPPRTMP